MRPVQNTSSTCDSNRTKARSTQAKFDVAQARFLGSTGEKSREGEQRKETSRIEADAVIFEQERNIRIVEAKAKLQIEKINYDNQAMIARGSQKRRVAMFYRNQACCCTT